MGSVVAVFMIALTSLFARGIGHSESPRFAPVEQLHHIHGLAVDLHDPDVLYVATHGGLVRLVGGRRWEYVGENRADLMGFTIHPTVPGVMYVSGHPDPSSHLPNPIGVMVSRDGGRTWQSLALLGKVDLHAMTMSADGRTLYGWNVGASPGLFQISVQDGAWARMDARGLQDVFSLAAHPEQSTVLLAGTRGGLVVSRDGGRTWSPMGTLLSGVPVTAVAYHPKDARHLFAYAVQPNLGLAKSEDGGEQWKSLGLFLGEKDAVSVFAISRQQPETIYVSTFGSDLYRSQDGGRRWDPLVRQGSPVAP